jgi:hypothetical protein
MWRGRLPRSARRRALARDYRGFAPPDLVQRLRNSAEGGHTLAALSNAPQMSRGGAVCGFLLLVGLVALVAKKT